MTKKTLSDVRQSFLDYFNGHGHEVVGSSSLVPHNDPTLMFANAGMNQFKDVFTGKETRPYSRAASAQKCVRAGGKHNDLDNVGYTARHHTFFEMMGNFSFGDYFKEEAIFYGWDFLTKTVGLPKEKLLATVYHTDDEAFNLWKKIAGLPDDRIIRIATNDNFWSMGDTGPCGPCSEIFYDHGEHIPGGPPGSPEEDGDRFIEIWNLVFMQYEKHEDGTQTDLPKPSIDTGMGLERMTAIIQGVHDNYDIDLFQDMITASQTLTGKADSKQIVSHRVIADHMRSSCFLMADGVLPSNEGRGYVLRRIMRRAMRHAHMLGAKEPLLYKLVPTLTELMGEQYPELSRANAVITENLRSEEERFQQTLDRGLKLLDEESGSLGKGEALKGDVAFKLYDTFGFPLDLTQDILRGRGMTVDVAGFDACMEEQKTRARKAWKGSGSGAVQAIWFSLKDQIGTTEFVGYDAQSADATIKAIIKNGEVVESADADDEVIIVLDKTPFYGESGGQVGDKGVLLDTDGSSIGVVDDAQKPMEDVIAHYVTLIKPVKLGASLTATIDAAKRESTKANHSATHLLHKALRDALGEHVTQKGSLVEPERLRFDISHGKAVSAEEIAAVEKAVNEVIALDTAVACKVMTPDAAIAAGALALFGEKYGDEVRVLTMGEYADGKPYSIELCGGTHVARTGEVQAFKVTSEGSVAAGIRRLEAVTGEAVRDYCIQSLEKLNQQIEQLLVQFETLASEKNADFKLANIEAIQKTPLGDVNALFAVEVKAAETTIEELQKDIKALQKQLAADKAKQAMAAADNIKPENIGGANFAHAHVENVSPKDLRPLAESMMKQVEGIVAATAENEGKVGVVVMVHPSLTNSYNAVDLVKIIVEALGGKGGGGRPEMAQGGAADVNKLDDAIAALKDSIRQSKAA